MPGFDNISPGSNMPPEVIVPYGLREDDKSERQKEDGYCKRKKPTRDKIPGGIVT